MPICIYCVNEKLASGFTKVEHVLPQAFGRFRNNLTLQNTVCDECNEFFGKTIDLYLARDTPDGFNRFRLGHRDPEQYKSLGKASTITHTIAEPDSPLLGAFVKQKFVRSNPDEGELGVELESQIGFAVSPAGPFKWFRTLALPTKEQLKELFETNHRHMEFVAIQDKEAVLRDLTALGMKYEITDTPPVSRVGTTPNQRIEGRAIIAEKFGRALAKIGLNYLASQYGAATALMAQFNTVRDCVRKEIALPLGSWASEAVLPLSADHGHALGLFWDAVAEALVARVAFHSWIVYRVVLAKGGFIIKPPLKDRAHFFNLRTMTVEPLVGRP